MTANAPLAYTTTKTDAAGQVETDAPLSLDRLEDIRDFYIWDDSRESAAIRESFCFCATSAAHPLGGTDIEPWLCDLLAHVRNKHAGETDFTVEFNNFIFRGHRDNTVVGSLLALRRIPSVVPRLSDLALPNNWAELFMHKSLLKGGLILIAAVTGQGKSTTLAAIVKSRLEAYGGFCRTIEDPPEQLLHGSHGQGICIQTAVDEKGKNESTFAGALKAALRSYPTIPTGGTMCMVGEVRDPDTAAEIVRASANGHLVLSTVHAPDVGTAIGRLYALAAAAMDHGAARDLLASTVRIVVHQELFIDRLEKGWKRGRLGGQMVYSGGSSSALANVIKDGKIATGLNQIASTQGVLLEQTLRTSFAELVDKLDPSSKSRML
jgi:Tfp pilus assembly pilus retraction ATPase PilT